MNRLSFNFWSLFCKSEEPQELLLQHLAPIKKIVNPLRFWNIEVLVNWYRHQLCRPLYTSQHKLDIKYFSQFSFVCNSHIFYCFDHYPECCFISKTRSWTFIEWKFSFWAFFANIKIVTIIVFCYGFKIW